MNLDEADYQIATRGWARFPEVVAADLLARLGPDLERVAAKRRALMVRNGIGEGTDGTAHHLLGEGTSLDDLLATLPLDSFIERYFNGPYILNSYGAVLNDRSSSAYVGKIHRDVRTYAANFRLLLNLLVMIDDFTIENGATYLLSGSHALPDRPKDDVFFATADRALGKAGDAIAFDSRLWHAAGVNASQGPRRGLTIVFARPFVKPQLDYPRFLGDRYVERSSPRLKQVLGYDARVAATLDEYYQPPERRAYKPGQG